MVIELTDRDGEQKCLVDPERAIFASDTCKLYLAQSLDGRQNLLLRTPRDAYMNDRVNLEAEMLKAFAIYSNKLDQLYRTQNALDESRSLHYDWLFPQLVDTFITDASQGGRQVNLLSILDGDAADYYPMVKLQAKYKVDARTAAWILGRFYKLQAFVEDVEYFLNFRPDQVLLDPRRHRMVYLGWAYLSETENCDSAKLAAATMLEWLGDNGTEHEAEFRELLEFIAHGPDAASLSGDEAHQLLYQNLEKWWGHKYYAFTYFDRGASIWKTITDAPAW